MGGPARGRTTCPREAGVGPSPPICWHRVSPRCWGSCRPRPGFSSASVSSTSTVREGRAHAATGAARNESAAGRRRLVAEPPVSAAPALPGVTLRPTHGGWARPCPPTCSGPLPKRRMAQTRGGSRQTGGPVCLAPSGLLRMARPPQAAPAPPRPPRPLPGSPPARSPCGSKSHSPGGPPGLGEGGPPYLNMP